MQLIAELGTAVWFTFTVSRQVGELGAEAHESKVTHTTRLKKSGLLKNPCHNAGTIWGGSGSDGLALQAAGELPCPGTSSVPGQGLVSAGGTSQRIAQCPVGLSGVSLVLPQKVSINRQPVFQTGISLYCGFWWFTLLPLFLCYFCCVNRSTGVASKGHLITMQNFIWNE